jgi:hypothetical protein
MNIFNNYDVKLRFRLDSHVSNEYINKWKIWKHKCEIITENKDIIYEWTSNCQLYSNIDMPYLDRDEGGIGGNNNQIHKQIRCRNSFEGYQYMPNYAGNDNDIIMLICNTDTEVWSFEELDDLIRGFIKTCNYHLDTHCVNGCIELVPKNSFNDDYLDFDK